MKNFATLDGLFKNKLDKQIFDKHNTKRIVRISYMPKGGNQTSYGYLFYNKYANNYPFYTIEQNYVSHLLLMQWCEENQVAYFVEEGKNTKKSFTERLKDNTEYIAYTINNN